MRLFCGLLVAFLALCLFPLTVGLLLASFCQLVSGELKGGRRCVAVEACESMMHDLTYAS